MSEATDTPPSFERIVEELERLVGQLEAGQLPLEQSLSLYERGVTLAKDGNALLEGAERRVEELQKSLARPPG